MAHRQVSVLISVDESTTPHVPKTKWPQYVAVSLGTVSNLF